MFSAEAIEAHATHLKAIGRADTTIRNARSYLRRLDRLLPMGILTALPEELDSQLAVPLPPRTRATYYDTIVRFYRWAAGRGNVIDYDPTAQMGRPRVPRGVPRPATDDQTAIACSRALDPWRLHCRLAAFAGARCCEIARLARDDIDERDIVLRGKGGHERIVPTPPEVWEMVERMPAGPVTARPGNTRTRGGPATEDWVSRSTNAHLQRVLGLAVTIHQFRHWYATQALANGGDLRAVQELLGHKSVATTQIYTAVPDERRRAVVAAMPRLGHLTR